MGGVSGLVVGISDVDAALPGIEAHPHARAVLGAGLGPGGRPSHAYLLHGPAGSGKRQIARALAGVLLADGAEDEQTARAVAARVARGTHPDLTWVAPSGAAEMLVSDIDEPVVVAATRTPFEARRRVFVIEAAETLNEQAANRLLKTLEEPPAYAHLVLVSDRKEEVLATIVSRCVHVRFDALAPQEIARGLLAEGAAGEEETARACARLALGDAGRARMLASEAGAGAVGGRGGVCALRAERRDWRAPVGAAAGRRHGVGCERGRAGRGAAGGGSADGAEQGAQETRAGGAGGAQAPRAPGARAGA